MSVNNLIVARAAAHAEWLAAPNAVTEAALAATCRALTAARRAEVPGAASPAIDVIAAIAAIEARQRANAAREAQLTAVHRAAGLYVRAQEWPRCGEGWPATAAERRAADLLAAHPEIEEELW